MNDRVQENLEIRRGPHGAFVPGLTAVPVSDAEEVMTILAKVRQSNGPPRFEIIHAHLRM
eukprot:SAG31_NODE_141_length_22675_cov_48.948879_16_plen_60_part_00